jgi:hypothetical protein
LQQDQQRQAQAQQVLAQAQAAVNNAQPAIQAAQRNLAAAQSMDKQLWAAANAFDNTLIADSAAQQIAQQNAGNHNNTPAQTAAYQAQFTTLSAQVQTDKNNYQNAQNAARNQDQVVSQAQNVVNQANMALGNAQSSLQQAQNTVAQDNAAVATDQAAYTKADIPATNLANEQALLVTLGQQLIQYQQLAGVTSNVALSLAAQLTQQANVAIQYTLPPLQTAAAQAQNSVNGR